MSEMKFIRENGDGDLDTSDKPLVGYVYLSLSSIVGDEDGGSFSGWVKPEIAERIKAALNVGPEIRKPVYF